MMETKEIEKKIKELEIRVTDLEQLVNTERILKYIAYSIYEPRDKTLLDTYMINLLMVITDWIEKHPVVLTRIEKLLKEE